MSTPTEQQPRTLEEAETIVELSSALARLQKNKDFKLLFEEHLFTNEVIRLHSLLAHPDKVMIDNRDRIIADLDALSNMKFALNMIETIGTSVSIQLDEFRSAQADNQAELEEEGE